MAEKIIPIAIEDKMREAYLNYSLSVIASRALPDVRDGLKPVHRRILYAAMGLDLAHNKPHKKSARLVGEVLGKYHPHGDTAVYDAMVRMAQDFNQRYILLEGHGNFGSIDGDSAAAMRYTEVRLTEIAENMLEEIPMETVDFKDNFDASLQEPTVLPTQLPNLLINGASGIAVGMSTDIPPHNLGEIIDALLHLMKNPNASLDTLMKYIPGPDFPTGAIVVGKNGIKEAYRTGQGRIILRGKTLIEKKGRKEQIVITEIPYQLSKSRLIEEIADLANKGKIDNIADLRDESDQEGLRIVIELKSNADSDLILNRLFKFTSLQTSYRINMLALVGKKPQVMDLKTILQHFIDFRREVVTRRTQYRLKKAEKRYEILKGIKKALDQIDLVISIIRNSSSTTMARESLMEVLKINEDQARAILEMQLQRLVGMETEKILGEIAELSTNIKDYRNILANKEELDKIIRSELLAVKKKFNDPRRTMIIEDEEKAIINQEDLIQEKEAVITFSYRHNIKRSSSEEHIRPGKNDYIIDITKGSSLDNLLFFTNTGDVYTLPVHKIPEHHGLSTGENLNQYLKIPFNEKVIKVICLSEDIKSKYIFFATRSGMVKKTLASEYFTNYTSIKAINLKDSDEVIGIQITDSKQEILLASKNGQTIRFQEDSFKPTGRNTQGSIGIRLAEGDELISMNLVQDNDYIVTISDNGKGKRSQVDEYKIQNRGGKGIKTCGSSIHQIAGVIPAKLNDYILLITNKEGLYPVSIADLNETARSGNMYRVFELEKDEKIIGVLKLPVYFEEENNI
ncbi:MAG: DNA gyrase subunit A [Halanaerobiales bacterium]|jgi:DNA gyrase subunit A|nr:DNA gyrase subunit A [Bacillota bacterium]HOA41029.1 DNA gyrase subunit A [Halanaerobiales bacterium]HPZ63297.1 DNA gyrase subunit A [Halanaerobiales bacterium]HQD04548.1 DNA gyrase subunit A [Halanaerobiales bacterium]